MDTFVQSVSLVGFWQLGTALNARLECAATGGTMSVAGGTLYAI